MRESGRARQTGSLDTATSRDQASARPALPSSPVVVSHDTAIQEPSADALRRARRDRVGVIDIGSNTLRLVVYDTPTRLPIPIFNEKAPCGLGRDLGRTGRLNEAGVAEALRSLARFARLSEAMGVGRLEVVATAAVRDAADGQDFVARVERETGLPVQVLSGAEEARLAAVGLLSGVPGADGMLGDLGGGSLDLVSLDSGQIGTFATLPVGHLRLSEDSGGANAEARVRVTEHLDSVPWIGSIAGRSLYAVGGSWRALARIFIDQTNHPLHVVDNYAIGFFDALKLANLIAGLSAATLSHLSGISPARLETLPAAAVAMAALLERARPAQVVFSGFGMREGQMLELLPPELRAQDSLIAACESFAERTGRFGFQGAEAQAWLQPLFPTETAAEARLRLATCILSDIGWSEHPDYRAIHAFLRVLRLPFAGLTHVERASLAIAIFVRYNGSMEDPAIVPVQGVLDNGGLDRAKTLGLALRLAFTISGGAPGLLSQTALQISDETLRLIVPDGRPVFASDAIDRRFRTLAKAMALKPKIG